MHRHKLITISFLLVVLMIPLIAFAGFGSTTFGNRPIGGRIFNTLPTPLVACSTPAGPLAAQPFIQAFSSPYFIRTVNSGMPRIGGYILGLYNPIPDMSGVCYNPETGAPVPAYEFKTYGVSRY